MLGASFCHELIQNMFTSIATEGNYAHASVFLAPHSQLRQSKHDIAFSRIILAFNHKYKSHCSFVYAYYVMLCTVCCL